MSLLDNNVYVENITERQHKFWKCARAICKTFAPVLQLCTRITWECIFFSQAEVRKFFTYIFIKLKASAVIAASFSKIIPKKIQERSSKWRLFDPGLLLNLASSAFSSPGPS